MIVEAVGHMTHIMEKEKLDEQLPKILQGILGLYRRHPDPYHITQVCLLPCIELEQEVLWQICCGVCVCVCVCEVRCGVRTYVYAYTCAHARLCVCSGVLAILSGTTIISPPLSSVSSL